MSTVHWTAEQRKIIEAEDRNILVSAAAGSGKTTVLIERILERVMNREHPKDVDRFVVVTFTRAAAVQMKEKLRTRLEKELEEHPEDSHLQRQLSLISSAHISTVHSFCGYVIQNYFHRIGLDPSYRQGTESELSLLKKETMEAILEQEYIEASEDFTAFAGLRMFNRSDDAMAEMVFLLYEKAMSEPFPEEWLCMLEQMLSVRTDAEWENSRFLEALTEETQKLFAGMKEEQKSLLSICKEPDGPYYFESRLEELGELLDALLACESYTQIRSTMQNMKFSAMRAKKDDSVNGEKKESVADRRNACKDELKSVYEKYYAKDIPEQIADLFRMAPPLCTLLRLTKRFLAAFTEAKRERNVVDFHDLEQLALSILLERDETTGTHRRTAAAVELSEYFEEVMIDEYQDSNRVQDTILSAIARTGKEGLPPNLFMVGDVKQSIYRFRNACPELFSEKLVSYGEEEEEEGMRIDLHQNFRSREVVLEGINDVFDKVMHRDLGGVEYDSDARLKAGRTYAETDARTADNISLYVIRDNREMEFEGRQAVRCIRDMMNPKNPLMVQDGAGYRPVTYRDIVILVRSVRSMGQPVFDVLSEAGIPVVMEHTRGFFETREISIMSAMLQVIDNPRQDIPLAAVLVSPMFGFTEEELAGIRMNTREKCLYDSLFSAGEELREKIHRFMKTLGNLREKVSYAAVAELIQDIYRETHIYEAVRMMQDGVQRIANMDRLMELAREFDGTTYHGLYQFVRYINRIREQKEEMGEVNIVGEEENVVRIMTMHKSKGLEFPVCILLGLGKNLVQANRSFLTVHPDLGVASAIIDSEKHTKKDNLYRSFLAMKNAQEDLGEEMRILYVAMSRAEEKLILIGSADESRLCCGNLNYFGRSRMKSYLDMLLPAALSGSRFFSCEYIEKEDLLEEAVSDIVRERVETEVLYNFDTGICYHKKVRDLLEQMETAGCGEISSLPVKVSVSDVKVKSMEEALEEGFTVLKHDEDIEDEMPVPAFLREKKPDAAHQGAAYGTIWHQVMAYIDFTKTDTEKDVREAVETLVQTGRLRKEESSVLNYKKLFGFFESDLGKQMKKAAAGGKLYREQPFVVSLPACEIFPEESETEEILVQGIIDGYYETEDGIVLMDYKTDSLQEGEEKKLVERYATQMALYKRALETMMDRPVTACVLYSFSLGRMITLPERKRGLDNV